MSKHDRQRKSQPASAPPVIVPPAPTAPGPTQDELQDDLDRDEITITADEVRGFIKAIAAGKAHVLPEMLAELAAEIAAGRAPEVTPELFEELKALLPQKPGPAPDAPPARIRVRFIESMCPYAAGDQAGFDAATATELVKRRIAVLDP